MDQGFITTITIEKACRKKMHVTALSQTIMEVGNA
jgi:hypothetical protein